MTDVPTKPTAFDLKNLVQTMPSRGILKGNLRSILTELALVQGCNASAWIGNPALMAKLSVGAGAMKRHIRALVTLGLITRKRKRYEIHTVVLVAAINEWIAAMDDDEVLLAKIESARAANRATLGAHKEVVPAVFVRRGPAPVLVPSSNAESMDLATHLERLRGNPGANLEKDSRTLAAVLAVADLTTAKRVLDFLRADKDQYWWRQILKSGAPSFARKFADFQVSFNATKPAALKTTETDEQGYGAAAQDQRAKMAAKRDARLAADATAAAQLIQE
jgi:hypothetical protein